MDLARRGKYCRRQHRPGLIMNGFRVQATTHGNMQPNHVQALASGGGCQRAVRIVLSGRDPPVSYNSTGGRQLLGRTLLLARQVGRGRIC